MFIPFQSARRRIGFLVCAVASTLVHARTVATEDFGAEYFIGSQPSSAYDMVQLLPAFRLQEGNTDLRGYSGTAGNVLIDGQHLANKGESVETLLKRIPASSVERIELIRSSAAGVDMQGFAVLANVVRRTENLLTGRVEVDYADFEHGFSAPRLGGVANLQTGDKVIDLQAAHYREIDDEHGYGFRNRYAEDGTPLRLSDYAQPEGTTYSEASGSPLQPLSGGTMRAAARAQDARMFADIESDIYFPASEHVVGAERERTRTLEGEFGYERLLAGGNQVDLLAIHRAERLRATESSTDSAGSELDSNDSDATETIVRGVYHRKGGRVSIDVGAEATLNTLDSHVALTEDGASVPLPAADVRVEERRLEMFITGSWKIASVLDAEAGIRFEKSQLLQSGDSELEKTLVYPKPRALLTYEVSPATRFRVLVEREVGQLDFDDFVSDPSVSSETITAGNKDLEPESLWRFELAWEYQFGKGSVVLTAREERISDVVDSVPVIAPEGIFDAVGNIGSGRREELQLDFNLPLDGAGLRGMTLKGSALLRDSQVVDPLTSERRPISEDLPAEAAVDLTQDLTKLRLRWGVGYALHEVETSYKVDEVERDRLDDRIGAFVEYKPDSRWTVRLYGYNLTNSPATRTRETYDGLRGASDIDYVERRELRSGRYYGINIQRTFGE